ncbi:Disease resistance protein RPP8 [Theobroma cacao]|uniref:Disease resistance protein RPP8 n=1 Tax=Theobroma cacao TaxID=3641 RepID=A0A061FM54_THECC|nr:Disease resistance protein RPP8 [Theobroma cacao]
MAEAIVSLAIERISDLLIHEAVFLHGVREEVEGLKAELQRMKSSLIDADRKQDQDELTCTLVSQIRDLAYEAEDVIDDFILQVAHQGGFRGFIKRFTKPSRLHKIGVEVKAIQTKLESISKNLLAYNRISGAEGSRSVFEMQQGLRRTYSHVEEEDVVSLEGITRHVLKQLMTEEDRLHVVVSIVGMGGIDDESWKLFRMKAFPVNKTESHVCPEALEMPGREMVKKCGGLPLAIAVLGGLLATKKTRAEWEMVQRNINARLNNFPLQDDYGKVNGILSLSYTELPFHLKPCFLYLGHYPEDWEISKRELIRLWIAEGFISPSWESGEMLMEDVAEQFLEQLINRCLVQVGKRDHTGVGVKTCHVHDLLRDLCVKKAQEENFLEIIQPPLNESDGNSLHVTLTASMARRIAIHPSKRVLNLVKNDVWPEWNVSSEIGNLHHLRYLRLRFGGTIILPRSIGKLKNLHTLYLINEVPRIPDVLFKLRCLRHIVVGNLLIYVPLLLRDTLKNIETLKYIGSKNLIENNAVLDLTNIRSLGISFERSKDVEPILKALIKSQRLVSLYLWLKDSIPYPNLEPLSHCHHLSKLFLRGKIQEDPHSSHHSMRFLPANIVKLTLWDCEMKQDPMAVLGKLPHLRTLFFESFSYVGTKMVCSANEFLQLDYLGIGPLKELEEWQIEKGAMPRLRSLELLKFSNLRSFPEGLKYITALQEMILLEMKRSLVERIQVIDGSEGEDFSNVRHIPSIQVMGTEED